MPDLTAMREPDAIWRTLRFRFALWISLLLLLFLLGFSLFIYRSLTDNLRSALDESLSLSAAQLAGGIDFSDDDDGVEFERELEMPGITGEQDLSVRVVDADGQPLYTDGTYGYVVLPGALPTQPAFSTRPDPFDDEEVRVYTLPVRLDGRVIAYIQTIRSLEDIEETQESLASVLQIGVPTFVLVIGVGGYLLAGRALAPIDTITMTARNISADDLSTRLDLPVTDDEVGRLAVTFNVMLERLDAAFRREKQFTSDASHELRTPLTVMRTIIEMTRTHPRSPSEYERALDDVYGEIERVQNLVESLLTLARAEGDNSGRFASVDLSALLHDVSETLRPLAEDKGLALSTTITLGLHCTGDYEALTRLFINLLDNAIKYTETGMIAIFAGIEEASLRVQINDSGTGITPEHLGRVFDRFYRGDVSRSSAGTGLGLTIARSIVHLHHGAITVNSVFGQGTTVTVTLPASGSVGMNVAIY